MGKNEFSIVLKQLFFHFPKVLANEKMFSIKYDQRGHVFCSRGVKNLMREDLSNTELVLE